MKNLLLIALFIIPFTVFSQGKLEKAKEDLSKDSQSTEESSERDRSIRLKRDHNNFFVDVFAEIGFYAFYGTLLGSSDYRSLTPYPYFYDATGEYLKVDLDSSKNSQFKIGASQYFNKGVKGIELNADYRVIPILGIEASYLNFSENTLQGKEYLNVTSLLLKYYRVREKNVSIWWGLGATHVGNEVNTWVFTYTIGTEIFPVKPISLYANYKQSFINSSSIDEFKIHIKYHIKKTAIYTGYQNVELGSETIKGIVYGIEYTF
ncbi:hypothetical protein [Lutibacter sp.]|uniref:hypothetical protein n=1 Tax=Lutibacter sp. TaxID=1925666 RepID=UPI00356A27F5